MGRRGRQRARSIAAVLLAAGLVAASSLAQPRGPRARLSIARAEAALDCPDAQTLAAAVNAHMGHQAVVDASSPASPAPSQFVQVELGRADGRYRAVVRLEGERRGARELDDPGDSCGALADALAITVALMLDEGRAPLPSSSPSATPPLPPPPPPPPPPSPPSLDAALQGGVALSVLPKATPVVHFDARYRAGRLRIGAGAMALGAVSTPYLAGAVRTSLVAGKGGVCAVALQTASEAAALEGCAWLWVGRLSLIGEGFVDEAEVGRLWVAPSLELRGLLRIAGPVDLVGSVAGLASTRKQTATVKNAGEAAALPRTGAMLTIGASVHFL